ncbi:MAG: hypothetical protein EZS28_018590, partial [Streblomastix strix]
PQFEKEAVVQYTDPYQQPFQQQAIRCETPTLSARRRSSIFEETLTPDPSVCRWLLDFISEDEYMVKESVHFILSENQLIRVVAYTFDVTKSQIQLSIEDEGCCGRFCNDSTQTLNEILIGNVNTLKLDLEKIEDDALLLKADKTQLIDSYSKTEADELLALKLNTSDKIDAYIKQEDDALLLLKADKTELIDAYSKTDADALLDEKLNITDQIDAFTKGEDDALLLLKADKTELIDAYSKIEADAILDQKLNITKQIDAYSKIEAYTLLYDKLNITDQIDAYLKTEDDALLLLKADKLTQLMHIRRLKPMPYLMANQTDQIDAYTKEEDDALLFLKANQSTTCTKTEIYYLISQFDVGDVDLSGYITLDTAQTITTNKTFNNACRLINFIDGMETITGASFVKYGADDSVVLLGAGGTKPISEFFSSVDDSNYVKKMVIGNLTSTSFIKSDKDDTSVLLAGGSDRLLSDFSCGGAKGFAPGMNIKIRTLPTQYAPTVSELCMPVGGPYGGFKLHITNTGKISCYVVGAFYFDERLLDAAGLSDFPELYAYIKERYPKPIGELLQPVPIGDQILQQQVKNNDDLIYASNEEFELPVPNAITKLDLSSQLKRQSFLASSGSDPQLIVYGDRITLIASYATTSVFPNGYLFKSYPQEARPKMGDQVIALVGTDVLKIQNIFCYIDHYGQHIISSRQLPSNAALVLNLIFYNQYESSKKINYDANNDGKIDILDRWNVNGRGQFEAQSYVYETVKRQTDLIEAGVQGLKRTNYLNSEIKLVDELAIYKANRAAYFINDVPFITYNFGAKLAQLDANYEAQQTVYKLFSTISKKVQPPNTKYVPVHVEQQEFSAIYLFKDIYDKSLAVQVAVSGQQNMLDCEFQGTYILDNYTNASASMSSSTSLAAEALPEEPESHIDEVIIKHEKQLGSSPQPQYTITNVHIQFTINDFFPLSAYNTFYIVDYDTCRVYVFNLYFESKGLNGRTQEEGHIPNSIFPADGQSLSFPAAVYGTQGGRQNNFSVNYYIVNSQFKMLYFQLSESQKSIPMDSADIFKYCASGMYYYI